MIRRHEGAQTVRSEVAWPRSWLAPIAFLLLAILLYAINLGSPPRFDELYHVLGARGYLAHGEPRIADGAYERVFLFTLTVAQLFAWFGESLSVARLPGLISMAVLATALFAWLRAVAGPAAAWLGAGAFLVSPFAVHVAQDIRFYGPNAMFFTLGALAIYAAFERRADAPAPPMQEALRPKAALLLVAALMLVAALYLQAVTLIGAVGIGLWLLPQLPWRRMADWARTRRGTALLLGLVALALLAVAAFALMPVWAQILHRFRWVPTWNEPSKNQFWFYHQWLLLYYPTLWPLFPVAVLMAVTYRPRPAMFCVAIFGTAFVLHSLAGPKALLYVTYSLPFLFALWGMALASVLSPLGRFFARLGQAVPRALGLGTAPRLGTGAAVAAVAFLVLANPATVRTATMLAGVTIPPEVPDPNWRDVGALLGDEIRTASVVIVTNELHSLYHFGRADIVISTSRLSELPGDKGEFTPDYRTGIPVVSTTQAIDQIIACFPDGLIITENTRWRQRGALTEAVADEIVRRTEPVSLPPGTGLRAYRWSKPASEAEPGPSREACRALTGLVSRT